MTAISLRSIRWDFPIVEVRPFRSYATTQAAAVLIQIGAAFDKPTKITVEAPVGAAGADSEDVDVRLLPPRLRLETVLLSALSVRHVLDPVDHASEVLFGLIMVLTITGAFSVAGAGQARVHTMLFAALGCNLAWGVIDGVFYLMGCLGESSRRIKAWDAVRTSTDPEEARRVLAGAVPPMLASVLEAAELDRVCLRLKALPELPDRKLLRKNDWLGALAVFVLVFLSTFPVVVPFIFMKDVRLALRISNGVGIVMLFLTGYMFGRHIGRHPVRTGIVMVVLGAALVSLTIKLGG